MNERFHLYPNGEGKADAQNSTYSNGSSNGPGRSQFVNGRYSSNGNGHNGPPQPDREAKGSEPEPPRLRETGSLSGRPRATGPVGIPADPPLTNPATGQTVLSGSLTAFSPSSLLSLLNIQKQNGWLRMSSQRVEGYIYVEKGEVWDAGLSRTSQGALAFFQLFGWRQGDFSFELASGAPPRRSISASLPVLQVRATLWLDSMNKYSSVIPNPGYLISIAEEPRSEVVIEPHQWAILTKIVSRTMSVTELAAELERDLMDIIGITVELVKMGVAVVRPPDEE